MGLWSEIFLIIWNRQQEPLAEDSSIAMPLTPLPALHKENTWEGKAVIVRVGVMQSDYGEEPFPPVPAMVDELRLLQRPS